MFHPVGNTPLFYSEYFSQMVGCRVSVKADYLNPGMSSKDRPALYMIECAMNEGRLHRGDTIVEASSGNTAIGLAMLGKSMGFRCHFFVSQKCSDEKKAMLALFGATFTVCTSSGDIDDPESTLGRAAAYTREHPNTFFCNQYYNKANILAHLNTTGPEIWDQTDGSITHFITGIGTGGTVSGVGAYLKSQNRDVRVIGVDPAGSVLHEYFRTGVMSAPGRYLIEGIGRSFMPGNLDFSCIDDICEVEDLKAVEAAWRFKNETGFLCGFSSAACIAALLSGKSKFRSTDHIVLFFADHGSRYLSKLYNEAWLDEYMPDYRGVYA